MKSIYCCPCGVETVCEWKDLNLSKVFQCPSCKVVMANVYPKSGGNAWITVDPKEVEFYDLIKDKE